MALHDLLVQVDLHPRQGPVEPQHVQDVVGGRRAVAGLQSLLGAHRIDQGVFPRVLRLRRPGAGLRQPCEGERRRVSSTPHLARGEHRNAGRIQAAAQMHAHGAAVQAVAHRLRVEVEKLLRIGVVRRGPRRRRPLGMPVPLDSRPEAARSILGPPRLDGERMARRQLAHRGEERAGAAAQRLGGQMGSHHPFVQRIGNVRRGQHRFHGAGEDEAPRRQRVIERPGADVVPGAEQRALLGVPYGEGVVAEQVVRAVPAPAHEGPEDQLRIGEAGALGKGNAERIAERVAVVETGIRGHHEAGAVVNGERVRGAAGQVGRRAWRTPAPEADPAFRPRRTFRSAVGERGQHGVQRLRAARPAHGSADRDRHGEVGLVISNGRPYCRNIRRSATFGGWRSSGSPIRCSKWCFRSKWTRCWRHSVGWRGWRGRCGRVCRSGRCARCWRH